MHPSPHEWPPCPRSVERSSPRLAHQPTGDAGRVSGSKTLLVRTDNTAVVSYINHQGGLRSHPLYRLAHQILVWSQGKLLSLRAVYIPGNLNVGADIPSRQGPWPGEWMLLNKVVKQIWRVFGQAQVDLFATQESAMSPLVHSSSSSSAGAGYHGTGMAKASSVCFSSDCVAPWSSGESAPGRSPAVASSPVLAGPSMVLRPNFSPRRLTLGDSCQEGSPLTGGRHPCARVMKTVGVASEGAQLIASGLSTEVVETILQSRALDTYVHRAAPWRKVDQLLICYGPLKRGLPASKQALSRWIVEAINMSYESLWPPIADGSQGSFQ